MSKEEYVEGVIRNYVEWIDKDVDIISENIRETEIDIKNLLYHAGHNDRYQKALDILAQMKEQINEVKELTD